MTRAHALLLDRWAVNQVGPTLLSLASGRTQRRVRARPRMDYLEIYKKLESLELGLLILSYKL